jgi:hypothetical protein
MSRRRVGFPEGTLRGNGKRHTDASNHTLRGAARVLSKREVLFVKPFVLIAVFIAMAIAPAFFALNVFSEKNRL